MSGPGSLGKNRRAVQRLQRCMSSTTTSVVMSFGDGNHGALGLPTSLMGLGVDAYEPTRVPSLPSDITSVTAGYYHCLAVTSHFGLGAETLRPSSAVDYLLRGLGSVVKDLRAVNTIVQRFKRCMSSRTAVMSFGDGNHGALGLPTSLMGLGVDAYEPTRVPSLPPDITSVTAGHYHSLAVTSQGQL